MVPVVCLFGGIHGTAVGYGSEKFV